KTDRHRLLDVLRDAEVRREQIGGPRRHDGKRDVGPRESIDTALHHPVASPDDEQVDTVFEQPLDLLGREPALRHLDPPWVDDTLALELPPQLGQATAER